jgi:geranylgeranyl diphosphate synthase type 3
VLSECYTPPHYCTSETTRGSTRRSITDMHSVDDVEDSSILRRGIPVAHSIFGTPQTINSANYVYFKALQDLLLMNNPKLVEIFTEELLNLHRGQGMDLYWRDSLTCPSEADYLEMVGNKTGGLFRLAIKLMQAESAVNVYVPIALYSLFLDLTC